MYRLLSFVLTLLLVCDCATNALAQSKEKPVRARLPKSDDLPSDIFFRDAFKEGLIGPRPATLGQPTSTNGGSKKTAEPPKATFSWKSLASAETLEDEIKSLQMEVKSTITTPSKFTGGGYQDARRLFTELATLFSIIQEYDGNVRWKEDAAVARDLFARAAANTKTTSIQAFNESKQRKLDLEELVRGGSLVQKSKEKQNNWELIHRGSLMQRFTKSYDDGLAIWTANDAAFAKNKQNIKHECELLMAFAVVLTQTGMEDGDDDDYAAYCTQLEKAAGSVLSSLEVNDAEAARKASSDVGQSCVACHEDYRG